MAKTHPLIDPGTGATLGWIVNCPACGNGHLFNTTPGPNGAGGSKPCWTFNGNLDRPTFSPSMLVGGVRDITDDEIARIQAGEHVEPTPRVCHSFVRDGRIEFLSDCTHELAGQSVELEERGIMFLRKM